MTGPDDTPRSPRVNPHDAEILRRLRHKHRMENLRFAGVVLAVLGGGCVLFGVIFGPSLGRARPIAHAVKCAANLRLIGQSWLDFANAKEGKFPDTLEELFRSQAIDPSYAICPQTGRALPEGVTPTTWPAGWLDACGDHVYYGRGLVLGAPADIIVARDRSMSNHEALKKLNVLFADGRVEFLTEQELVAATAKSDTLRSEWEAAGRLPRR